MKHRMVIEMNGKQHILTLGLGFLERLNTKYTTVFEGLPVGALALPKCITELGMKNPVIVKDIIFFGTMENVHRPSEDEIDEWIYEQLDDEETENKMFDDFFDYLTLVSGAKKFAKAIEEQKAKLQAQQSLLEEQKEAPKKKASKK